jgi:hypothetical protein
LLNLSHGEVTEKFIQVQNHLRTFEAKEKIEANVKFEESQHMKEALRAIDIENRLTAIMNLFLFSEDNSHLLLVWWQTKDDRVRALIVANYYSLQYEPTSYIPPFDAYTKRFETKEAQQRKEEIEWAKKNRIKNAKNILRWINTNVKIDENAPSKLLLIINKYKQVAEGK